MNILTIGGATQDIFLHYEGTDFMTITKKNMIANYMLFQSGEKKEIDAITYNTGGGATNAATAFVRLGFTTGCFCNIGNDQAGKSILEKLTQEKVKTDFVNIDHTIGTGQSFIINSQQDEATVFAYRGANCNLSANYIPVDYIKTCSYIYITSLSNKAANTLPQITAIAKQYSIPIAINPGISQLATGTKILKESLANINILILNSAEAQIFMLALVQNSKIYKKTLECCNQGSPTGINLNNNKAYLLHNPLAYEDRFFSIRQFFKEVLKMGPKIVIVTNGCNGVYVATKQQVIFCPSIKITVSNTIGAGDAFGSCFVASLLRGCSIQDALINGNVNSASVLQHIGAKTGLLTQSQLQEQRKIIDQTLLQQFSL